MESNKKPEKIGVAVITHHAKKHLLHCLPPLLGSSLNPRVLVVNSSSQDGTIELAKSLDAETLVIPRAEFNHGSTRELARKTLNTDIVVFVTPDAYAINENVLMTLIAPIVQNQASISYARQIPHDGANFFASFHREFNYPPHSHIRGLADLETYGMYTFFCSNSFAAYRNKALDEIQGFQSVLLGEDTIAVAKLLQKGHKIAYAADAIVKHSHSYSLKQEFCRHFDTGLARKQYGEFLSVAGSDFKRGKAYAKTLANRILKEKPYLFPYALLHIAAKWIGYQVGSRSAKAPLWWKKWLTSQDFYWVSKVANNSRGV